jgi:hypothetical protein
MMPTIRTRTSDPQSNASVTPTSQGHAGADVLVVAGQEVGKGGDVGVNCASDHGPGSRVGSTSDAVVHVHVDGDVAPLDPDGVARAVPTSAIATSPGTPESLARSDVFIGHPLDSAKDAVDGVADKLLVDDNMVTVDGMVTDMRTLTVSNWLGIPLMASNQPSMPPVTRHQRGS